MIIINYQAIGYISFKMNQFEKKKKTKCNNVKIIFFDFIYMYIKTIF